MQEFFDESNGCLKTITDDLSVGKNKFSINPDLRPLTMNIEKAIEMVCNFKMEPPKGDRLYNTNQTHSQRMSVKNEMNFNEDHPKALPPLDSTKKRRTTNATENASASDININKPFSVTAKDIDSESRMFNRQKSTTRKSDTPAFEPVKVAKTEYKTKFEKIKFDRKPDNNYVTPIIIQPKVPIEPVKISEAPIAITNKIDTKEETKVQARSNQEEGSTVKQKNPSISTQNQTNTALAQTSHDIPVKAKIESRNLHSNLL